MGGLFDDRGEDRSIDKAHEEESLKDGIRELWRLLEKLGSFGRIAHD